MQCEDIILIHNKTNKVVYCNSVSIMCYINNISQIHSTPICLYWYFRGKFQSGGGVLKGLSKLLILLPCLSHPPPPDSLTPYLGNNNGQIKQYIPNTLLTMGTRKWPYIGILEAISKVEVVY